MRSAEQSEAKTPRPETQYCRKQDQLLPAFFMPLPFAAIKGIVTVSTIGEIACLHEIGSITDDKRLSSSFFTIREML